MVLRSISFLRLASELSQTQDLNFRLSPPSVSVQQKRSQTWVTLSGDPRFKVSLSPNPGAHWGPSVSLPDFRLVTGRV